MSNETKDIALLETLKPRAEQSEEWAIKMILDLKQSAFPKVRQAAAQIIEELGVGP